MRCDWLGALAAALLIGCSSGSTLAPGRATEADVKAVMGEPLETRRRTDGETVLWYSREIPDRAYGRGNYAARIAPDGRLISLEQRLNDVNIAKLLPDVSRAEDVRDALGPPHRSYRLPGEGREVWEYQLEGFQRPLTLYVQLSSDQIVREVFMLERRGVASRDKR
jgi:hypothetical protein